MFYVLCLDSFYFRPFFSLSNLIDGKKSYMIQKPILTLAGEAKISFKKALPALRPQNCYKPIHTLARAHTLHLPL